MTDVLTPPAPASGRSPAAPIEAPPARRVQRPRWRDTRLFGACCSSCSRSSWGRDSSTARPGTSPVAERDPRPPGRARARRGDLAPVKAHLPTPWPGADYFAASAGSLAALLGRPVAAGELLPVDALSRGQAAASRIVPWWSRPDGCRSCKPATTSTSTFSPALRSRGPRGPGADRCRVHRAETIGTGESSIQLRVSPQDRDQRGRREPVRPGRRRPRRARPAASTGAPGPSSVPATG